MQGQKISHYEILEKLGEGGAGDLAHGLDTLAERMEMHPRKLSELINQGLGKNFMGLINSYRIELAKRRLQSPRDPGETVLEVMYEVGFNSKSSFNTLFKKTTGMTPTAYRNQYR